MDLFLHRKLIIITLALVSFVGLVLWFFNFSKGDYAWGDFIKFKRLNPPKFLFLADADADGVAEEYRLSDGTLEIFENRTIWKSPEGWWIDHVAISDVTGDGKPDINLSVWKEGSFGSSRPFWIKENDRDVKNHYFVFSLEQEKMKAVWQSSSLTVPNCSFQFVDIDGDGDNELIAEEGDYRDWPACIPKVKTIWGWNGWGFSREDLQVE